MAITLYFSNQLEPLADRLYANLHPHDGGGGVLDPSVVIVPNMNLSKWIKLGLADKTGICMNICFDFLESGLWNMLRVLDRRARPEPELIDRDALAILIFSVLMDMDAAIPELRSIQRYLTSPEPKDADGGALRSWQLAGALALLFEEYAYHRGDMIARWTSDRPVDDPIEAGQKWIYREIGRRKEQLGRLLDRNLCSIDEYAGQIIGARDTVAVDGASGLKKVHFFGISQISPFHLQLLSALQAFFDIHIYSLNPSREYWEDIQTPLEKKWIRRRGAHHLAFSEDEANAGDLFASADHPLLSAWGRPGRESVRLLCRLTDYDFQAGFNEIPRPDTILAAIAHSLLNLDHQPPVSTPREQDTSLQIVACPGIRREVETVYFSILHNLATDPRLCLTDIAVMVSDMPRYKPVIDAVFSREPACITYNLVDSYARTESAVAQAVIAVIELARGTFSRKQVFDLLRNPCVMRCWHYGPDALATWIAWADALGIFHGVAHDVPSGDGGPAGGCYSWRQGLERLRLARIMAMPASMGDAAGLHFSGLVPYADMDTGNERMLETFCRIVETLAAAVAPLQMPAASTRTWRDALFGLLDQFIDIAPDMRGEEAVYQSLVRAFDRLIRYDVRAAAKPPRSWPSDALWTFVRSHLAGISGGQGDYLTGGVTVSALMPMRPIPFKVVYVLGLEEGRFPGRSTLSQLDLRNRRRRIGDISPAERNRYLFLEILIATRRKLYLSYVSRDLQKDRDLAPCSVVQQLRRFVERQLLGGRPFKIRQIPIKAHSPAFLSADSVNTWSDVMARTAIAQQIGSYRRNGLWKAFVQRATDAQMTAVARYNPQLGLPERPSAPGGERLTVAIGWLKGFLLDPVGTVTRFHLDAGEAADPAMQLVAAMDAPLACRFPVDVTVRTTPVHRWLRRQVANGNDGSADRLLDEEFETIYGDMHRQSRVPCGPFGTLDKARRKQEALELAAQLNPFITRMQSSRQLFAGVTIGAAVDRIPMEGGDSLRLDPVSIPLAGQPADRLPKTVELHGGLPWIWQDEAAAWHCLTVTGSNRRPQTADRYTIEPLLNLMALAAGGVPCPWSDATQITLHTVCRNHSLSLTYPFDARHSSTYLRQLLDAWLRPWPLVWLPFETIIDRRDWRALILADTVSDEERANFQRGLDDIRQALSDVNAELVDAVVTADSLDRARERFKVLMP